MKIALFAAFIGICGIVTAIPLTSQYGHPSGIVADKVLLEKQKDILRLFMHVSQPSAFHDQYQLGQSFEIESSLDQFTNVKAVKEFVQLYKAGLLPRGKIFSILNDFHKNQAISLFNVFYYAKDYETFYKVACWARNYINEGMFIYALNVAILHRPDCQGMTLPAPYEVHPYYFVNSNIITKARNAKLQNFALYKPEVIKSLMKDPSLAVEASTLNKHDYEALALGTYQQDYNVPFEQSPLKPIEKTPEGIPVVSFKSNYTSNVGYEQAVLSYFTDDIDLNTYHYYFNLAFPTWMKNSMSSFKSERRGELYYYFYQQILARFYMERLSNGLGSINLHKPSPYVCTLQYENGLPFPMRPKTMTLAGKSLLQQETIDILEGRILNAIDAGVVVTDDGEKIPLYTPEGVNILGNLIQSNADSANPRYYRDIITMSKSLFGHYPIRDVNAYKLVPSVLEHYETAMRDPAFYSIYKRIINYFLYYKRNLPTYKYTDLLYPGVKIQSVNFDELITYFDYYDIDLTNAIDTDFTVSPVPRVLVKSRQMRLNHAPYNFKINVVSEKATKAVVRVYLGPKYDEMGNILTIDENRVNFVELDKFVYDLQPGQNFIVRNSRQALHTMGDRTTYFELYKQVMNAYTGKVEMEVTGPYKACGFPNRLLLPKGRRGGMEFKIFVAISPVEIEKDVAMGYPLDRKIDLTQFGVPNVYATDVTIYHKKYEDVMMNKVHQF